MTSRASLQSQQGFFTDTLRAGFKAVADAARHVRIRTDRLSAYADSLPDAPPANLLDPAWHFTGGEEETAAYIMTLDSINFGSGYKEFLDAEGCPFISHSIYFTLSLRLKEAFEKKALTAQDLAAIRAEDVGAILHFDPATPYSREFLALCARALRETGGYVLAQGGSFMDTVRRAHGSAESFVQSLASLENFQDAHAYRGQTVGFYKRAQIMAADLQLAFAQSGTPLFHDAHRLTMFADNAVPHVLRTDGILEYDQALADRIARGEILASGSEEEVEIRACAAHAVVLIARHKGLTDVNIDHRLWHRQTEDPAYRQSPTHRTLSWFY